MSMIHQIQVQGPGIHDVIAVEAVSGWAGICERASWVHWSCFSGHAICTFHTLLLALLTPCILLSPIDERNRARCSCTRKVIPFHCHTSDYVNAFYLAGHVTCDIT